jgi:hypothetical protein
VSGDRVGLPLGVGTMGDRTVRAGAVPQHGGFPQLNDAFLAFIAMDPDARAQYLGERRS